MKHEKILILKNDRGGDLFISLKTISSLLKNNDVTIFLSSLNMNLNFIFLNKDINKSISKISKFICIFVF